MSQIHYYYANDSNQPVGPFSLAELQKMLAQGILAAETLICEEGGVEWVPLCPPSTGPTPSTQTPNGPSQSNRASTPLPEEPNPAAQKVEQNAITSAIASVLLPGVSIFFGVALYRSARLPVFYAMFGGPLLFLLLAAISLLGFIIALKILRVRGIRQRKPGPYAAAWVGFSLFLVSIVVIAGIALKILIHAQSTP